jgi:SAM-dependent methyltransferase
MADRIRAQRALERQDSEAARLAEEVRRFLQPRGDERALDAGTGTGALAFALAPLVREVVGVDHDPERLRLARERAASGVPNVSFLDGDIRKLDVERQSFDLAATMRTLHHVPRPELVVAELTRVTRPDGRILVIDQIAPADPLVALELDRFERARDPQHIRLLPDGDHRAFFEANNLVVLRERYERAAIPVAEYLDLAACEGEARERAIALAPSDPYWRETGWYLARRAEIAK